jgi:AcrR family transcriptional regulator
VSPAPARTSRAAIVAAARALLEDGGLDAVTMQAVADRVGVRAPSLYKRFPGRPALIAAVARDVAAELDAVVASALEVPDPAQAVHLLADRYRAFARRSPGAYQLLFSRLLPEAHPTAEQNAAGAAGLLLIAERLAGRERALETARLLTAFAHGFASMELAGAFRLGGDVDAAYRFAIDAIVAGVNAAGRPAETVRR